MVRVVDASADVTDALLALARGAGDGSIEESAVLEGVLSAAEVIGRKLLEPQVFNAIRGERYRSILKKVPSDPSTMHVQRSELAARLSSSAKFATMLEHTDTRPVRVPPIASFLSTYPCRTPVHRTAVADMKRS